MNPPFNITPASFLSDAALAGSLLSSTSKIDVVRILDQQTSSQVFFGARPVKAEVRECARVMDYPVETGVTLSDHRISMPTEIIMTCVISSDQYSIAYPAIRNAWISATLLSVQTRTGTYKNMILQEIPHDEDPDMFTAVTITLKMREVIMIAPSSTAPSGLLVNFVPANPAYQATVNSGLIAATNATSAALSYFHAATIFGGML